jgi:transposase
MILLMLNLLLVILLQFKVKTRKLTEAKLVTSSSVKSEKKIEPI